MADFLILAPHAAGDDIFTRDISDRVADLIKGYEVVNTKFVKPGNSMSKPNGSNVENFNDLPAIVFGGQILGYNWSNRSTYPPNVCH